KSILKGSSLQCKSSLREFVLRLNWQLWLFARPLLWKYFLLQWGKYIHSKGLFLFSYEEVHKMDAQLLLEYLWVLLILIGLEGLLAADNALVLAIMVKHLPEEKRKKALFYGLVGAFILRFGSLFIISFLVDVWQVQ